ncbi:hypothetical protein [Salinicola acroporae]|uniref:Phage tail protein n=1 Tax=Salinicola acroporae TaxID=1541440 RepID=A0ABT6I479_9GAMM|nr:hypothetical protein [Salinicola acroporae]MDH4572467.1 hypothetical protein [Salinicola acroporae]
MIEYKHDINRLNSLKKRFNDGVVEKSLRQSVATATSRVRTYISREVRGVYPLRAKDLNGKVQIRKYRQMATRALIYTGRRLPLEQFAPKTRWVTVSSRRKVKSGPRKGSMARRRGVSVAIRRDKGRQLVAGGWYAKGEIMRRAKDGSPRIQYGPSIPGMVAHESVITGATDVARDVLPREFSRRMEVLLEEEGKK